MPQRRRIRVAIAAPVDQASRVLLVEALDLAEAEAQREMRGTPSPPIGGRGRGPARSAGRVRWACSDVSGIPHFTPTLSAPGGGEGDVEWRDDFLQRLQRAIPVAVVDIDREHRDPVL